MKDTFYFSHDYNARHDPKIISVQMEYGMQGIGVFWCLVEMLYEQGGFIRTEYERIAFELRTDANVLEWIINESGLFVVKEDTFYSETVLQRLEKRNNKSAKARESVTKRWNDYRENTNAIRSNNEGNTIKERKVKEIKVKEIKEKRKKVFIPPALSEVETYFHENGFDKTVAERFFKYYDVAGWKDAKGSQVQNWKQKAQAVWFKDDNRTKLNGSIPKSNKWAIYDTQEND